MAPTKILLLGESATLAHVVRLIRLSRTIDREEFEVHFAADKYFSFAYEREPFQKHNIYSRSPEAFDQILRKKGVLFDEAILERYVAEDLKLLETLSPELVVGDFRLSLAVSAPKFGIPYVALTNAYWSPFAEGREYRVPYLPILKNFTWSKFLCDSMANLATAGFSKILPKAFEEQGRGLDKVRKNHGLQPFVDYLTGFTWADYVLYGDCPELVPTANLPLTHQYIGPVIWSPAVPLPQWWKEIPADIPLIYVSLGSSGDKYLVPAVIKALSSLDVTIVVATGGRDFSNDLGKKVFHTDYLPGDIVAQRSQLVITNGGSPTSYQALCAGVPVIGLPLNLDHFLCMHFVEKSGAGYSLRSDSFHQGRFAALVKQALVSKDLKECAERVGRSLRAYDVDTLFPNVLREILKTGVQAREPH